MNYRQTVDYLYEHLPMFTRVGVSAFKKDLTNTIAFCAWLGNPQTQFRSVHIGGTNGKGSTSHMLAAILQTAGYKTGLYTSPHLKDFRERIRINGEMISEEEVVQFVASAKTLIGDIAPSFFETTVAMAFDHFARHQVEIAIVEVGLGGRLDSTNVITPLLSVITNISYDHMNLLGNTLEEIAAEKAGIIKPGIPVVIGERQASTQEVFLERAKAAAAPITFATDEWELKSAESPENDLLALTSFSVKDGSELPLSLDLTGSYQEKNLKTVLSAVADLRAQGFLISDHHLSSALRQVKKITGLAGRWQILNTAPLTICDTGHNEGGIREIVHSLAKLTYDRLHLVFGMVKDKDISAVLQLLPVTATYYFCAPALERALPAATLKKQAAAFGLTGTVYPSVIKAIQAARNAAQKTDLIFIGGSTFVVAEAL